jgi:hypothetical protein
MDWQAAGGSWSGGAPGRDSGLPGRDHGLPRRQQGLPRPPGVPGMPGWTLTQPRPGWHVWTTPTGRSYVKEPWRYTA